MAILVIRDIDEVIMARLKGRAAAQGHSEEEEARAILRDNLRDEPLQPADTLGSAMRALFAPLGGVEFPPDLRERGHRPPPDFSGSAFDARDYP